MKLSVLSPVLLGCFHVSLGLEALQNSIQLEMYDSTVGYHCRRYYTRDGYIGCGSSKGGDEGVIRHAGDTQAELDALAGDQSVNYPVTVIMGEQFFTKSNVDKLAAWGNVASVMLTPASDTAAVDFNHANTQNGLNPVGDDLLDTAIPFHVVRLVGTEVSKMTQYAASNKAIGYTASSAHHLRVEAYYGPDTNEQECHDKNWCRWTGGVSTWGTVGKIVDDRDIVLAATNIDSRSLFPDLALGSNQAAGGIVALLAAAHALRPVQGQLVDLEKQIAFAMFQGEAYGRMGSKRFLKDLESGCVADRSLDNDETTSCISPPARSMLFHEVAGNASFASVIGVSGILGGDAGTIYAHTHAETQESMTDTLQDLGVNAGVEVAIAEANTIPPQASVASFAEKGFTNVVLLSGNEKELPASFNSRFDVVASNATTYTSKIASVATVLAKSLISEAWGAENPENLETLLGNVVVDTDEVENLVDCFLTDFDCSLSEYYLNFTGVASYQRRYPAGNLAKAGAPIPLTAQPFNAFNAENGAMGLVAEFLRTYLTDMLSPELPNNLGEETRCFSDRQCDASDAGLNCAGVLGSTSNSTMICRRNKCTCSTIAYHPAIAPGIVLTTTENGFLDWKHSDNNDAVYSAPTIRFLSIGVYQKAPLAAEIVGLVLGLVFTAVSGVMFSRMTKTTNEKLKLL